MNTVSTNRYNLYVEDADEKTLSAFATALAKSGLDKCIIQSPDEPTLFTSEVMDVEWRNDLEEETIEAELYKLAVAFPDLKLHFIAEYTEDTETIGLGFEVKFHGQLYQRADMVSTLSEFSVPAPFEQRDVILQKEHERSIRVNDLLDRVVNKTDYDLLYAQKAALLDALYNGTPIPKQALEGLISLLDQMGDLGEAIGRFQYDAIEPPYPMQPDYEKKICVFPPEPEPKLHILCEEMEGSNGIREFKILGTSRDQEGLQELMQAKIEKDEYGFIAQNGIQEQSSTHFSTEFHDCFVEYYILDEDVLSREQTLALLNTKEYDPTFYYPETLRTTLTSVLSQIVADEGYGELDVAKGVESYLQNKEVHAELKDAYWFYPDDVNEVRARDFWNKVISSDLEKNPDLFSDLGIVPVFKAPDNFQEVLIASIYDAAKDLRLPSVNVQQICEDCLHSGGFRTKVTELFGDIRCLDESTQLVAAAFCHEYLMIKLQPEPMKNNGGLDQIISDAASRKKESSVKTADKEQSR